MRLRMAATRQATVTAKSATSATVSVFLFTFPPLKRKRISPRPEARDGG